MMIGAYLDCSGGITAKMVLGALLDAGLPHEMLKREIAKLGVGDFAIESEKTVKTGVPCTKVGMRFEATDTARSCMEIIELIRSSALDQRTVGMATDVFEVLAKAEGKVHGCRPEDVHFHEIGSLANIAAVCASVAFLPTRPLLSSRLPLGSGTITCSHGVIKLPAPATLEIIRDLRLPSYEAGIKGELVTPTGAAIVAVMASGFSDRPPEVEPKKTGIGAGDENLSVPNVLRLRVFEREQHAQLNRNF